MTVTLPSFSADWLPPLAWLVGASLLWWWLRHELTPRRVVSLIESENSLSLRLLLAAVIVIYTLNMQAAGRLGAELVALNWTLVGSLLALGVAKVVSKAFAAAPPATTVNTKKTSIDAKEVTVHETPASQAE